LFCFVCLFCLLLGGCCEHEHEHEHTEGVNVNLKFGDKGNSGHNTNCTFIYTLDAAVWDQIQISGDLVFICSILLWGQKGVYNYMHWLGAGHITFYGKKYGNLEILKQQVQQQQPFNNENRIS